MYPRSDLRMRLLFSGSRPRASLSRGRLSVQASTRPPSGNKVVGMGGVGVDFLASLASFPQV